MSPSPICAYFQRWCRIECGLLRVKIRNTSGFMGIWILAEMGWGCLFFFFLSPSNHSSPNFWPFSNWATSIKFWMLPPISISQGCFLRNYRKNYSWVNFLSFWILIRRCMRTGVCGRFESFIIELAQQNIVCSLLTLFSIHLHRKIPLLKKNCHFCSFQTRTTVLT